MRRQSFVLLIAVPLLCAFDWFERLAAPKSELLDPHWRQSGDLAAPADLHDAFNGFLQKFVASGPQGINRVDYAAVGSDDKTALKDYLTSLQMVEVTALTADDQLAFWINLYNAATLDVVLDHYLVSSIKDITFGSALASGPWNQKLLQVEGHALSLNDIEHGIIRPVFNDPRIHYAVNCAALACPNLQRTAFTGGNLDMLLQSGAKAYVNNPRGVSVDPSGKLIVSSIYNWFQPDFGGSEAAVLAHLNDFAEPDLSARLNTASGIDTYRYDWSLNDQDR